MMKLRVSSELDTDYLYFAMRFGASRNFLRTGEHRERQGRYRKLTNKKKGSCTNPADSRTAQVVKIQSADEYICSLEED